MISSTLLPNLSREWMVSKTSGLKIGSNSARESARRTMLDIVENMIIGEDGKAKEEQTRKFMARDGPRRSDANDESFADGKGRIFFHCHSLRFSWS